jgi:3-methyladenine DNA glycosylase AlkD
MSGTRATKRASAARSKTAPRSLDAEVDRIVAALRRKGSKTARDGLVRFAIPSERAFGVSMKDVQALAKGIGRDHALALALWETGWHEVRALCAYVAEPERVTPAEMDRWCRDFDNWAVCDTLCFALFDKTSLAWGRIAPWCRLKEEFVRRAGYALIASLAVHDKTSPDPKFARLLPLIEKGARDERNFVKKGVSWALRTIGRRSPALRKSAIAVARRLAASEDAAARWVGKDALRDFR